MDVERGRANRFWLAPHICACHSEGQVILLDLRRDKYLAVAGAQAGALAEAVEGWPTSSTTASKPLPGDSGALAARLIEDGLVTDTPPSRMRAPASALVEATATLGDVDSAVVRLSAGQVSGFLRSAASAALSLRFRSLLHVVQAVENRKARNQRGKTAPSLDALRAAVGTYERLRPLLYTSRDACLFDSLALVHFLSRRSLFPAWVIGVKTAPFAAHSWVQSEGVVLNDLHERVRSFTPILVV